MYARHSKYCRRIHTKVIVMIFPRVVVGVQGQVEMWKEKPYLSVFHYTNITELRKFLFFFL